MGFRHARGFAVDRVPPEPLVVPHPDASRGAVQDVAIVDLVVRQGQRVAPCVVVQTGSPKISAFRIAQGDRTSIRVRAIVPQRARRSRHVRGKPGDREDDQGSAWHMLGRERLARPRKAAPSTHPRQRGMVSAARADVIKNAVRVSVMMNRLCQARTRVNGNDPCGGDHVPPTQAPSSSRNRGLPAVAPPSTR